MHLTDYRERAWALWKLGQAQPVEAVSAASALAYGTVLACSPHLFRVYPALFTAMRQVMGERAWAGLFCAAGLLQAFWLLSGYWRARQLTAMAMVGLWAFVAAMYWRGGAYVPSLGLFLVEGLANGWIGARLSRLYAGRPARSVPGGWSALDG